jgi:transposase
VPMLAELIDAVVGVDTHRDTHEVEIALPTGTPIGTRKISNDRAGFAELLAWIVDHAPGPRVVVSIEGTRSFGVGLARAVAAAGPTVIECEQPNHKARRGKGKSDPIDAHLAVLAVPIALASFQFMLTRSAGLSADLGVRWCGLML